LDETPEAPRGLPQIIDRSAATAGSAIKRNFIGTGWLMSAEEFVAFWGNERIASISTGSAKGDVHVAPLDVRLSTAGSMFPLSPTRGACGTIAPARAVLSPRGTGHTAPRSSTALRERSPATRPDARRRWRLNRDTIGAQSS